MSEPIDADALEDAVRRGGVSVLLTSEVLELFSKLRQVRGSADEWWKEYDKSQTEVRRERERADAAERHLVYQEVKNVDAIREVKADLARAQEAIEAIRSLPSYQAEEPGGIYQAVDADEVADILDIYDEKGSSDAKA